jgi:hypothetical protein
MAAVMQVLEGWLLFQQGKWKEAMRVTQAAEARAGRDRRLCDARQHTVFLRTNGAPGRPLSIKRSCFSKTPSGHYQARFAKHPNLARSLANMALAKRGIALQLQKRIDREVQRRRKTSASRHGKRGGDQTAIMIIEIMAREHETREPDSRKHDYLASD